jgi:hypothetical protein
VESNRARRLWRSILHSLGQLVRHRENQLFMRTGTGSAAVIDFLGIGAQKAATTWLHHNLARHPGVAMPQKKELHFWDRRRERGVDWWFGRFESLPADRKRGEITPAYGILDRETVQEIACLLPNVRLLFSIRNPIDRAWSAARMGLTRNGKRIEEMDSNKLMKLFQNPPQMMRGDYISCIDTWTSVFPAEQLHISFFDDVVCDPKRVLAGVAQHLGIDSLFWTESSPNDVSAPVFAGAPAEMPPEIRDFLRDMHAKQINELERRFQRNLSHWTN